MTIPNPNDDMNLESNRYWFQFSDIYVFPNIIYFNSWSHLLVLLDQSDFKKISDNMVIYNRDNRILISKQWDEIFKKLVPHRRTGKTTGI